MYKYFNYFYAIYKKILDLDRLEREIFQIDRPQLKDLQDIWKVLVKIDTPINLKDYWQSGQWDQLCRSDSRDRNNCSDSENPNLKALAQVLSNFI